MIKQNLQKGAVSTGAIIGIVVAIIIVALGFWYFMANPMPAGTGDQNATTTPTGTNGDTAVQTNTAGGKVYTNIKNKYSVNFAADAQYNIANPDDVVFTFPNGTSTKYATLHIAVGTDVTHLAYCLVVPQGAVGAATTTINGHSFLTYNVGGSATANTGTIYYRLLHKEAPYENACYEIQKAPQGSATLNAKLNAVLQSLTFI